MTRTNKMKSRFRRLSFTLVELMVAMVVFSILLLMMFQFFSGAQRVWVTMEKRNEIYADARVAMEIISTMLQNAYVMDGNVPFLFVKGTDSRGQRNDSIFFATTSMQNVPGKNPLKYVAFSRMEMKTADADNADDFGEKGGTGEEFLKIAVFSDEDGDDFDGYFPPYGLVANVDSVSDARSKLETIMSNKLKNFDSSLDSSIIAKRVTAFEIQCYSQDTATNMGIKPDTTSTRIDKIPFMMVFKISMLSKADFVIWQELLDNSTAAAAKSFREENEYTFSRSVYLGDRSSRVIHE